MAWSAFDIEDADLDMMGHPLLNLVRCTGQGWGCMAAWLCDVGGHRAGYASVVRRPDSADALRPPASCTPRPFLSVPVPCPGARLRADLLQRSGDYPLRPRALHPAQAATQAPAAGLPADSRAVSCPASWQQAQPAGTAAARLEPFPPARAGALQLWQRVPAPFTRQPCPKHACPRDRPQQVVVCLGGTFAPCMPAPPSCFPGLPLA